MDNLQPFLELNNYINYQDILVYDNEKSIYALNQSNLLKKNSRKMIPQIDENSRIYLEKYYEEPNKQLKTFLTKLNINLPRWL